MGLQEYDKARDCLVRARRIFENSGNSTFAALTDSYLAELALRRGRAREAANRAEKAFRVFSRQKLANRSAQSRLQAAAAAYVMGDETRALRLARVALKTVEGLFAPGLTYKCHHLIGRVQAKRGESSAALKSLRHSVEIIEQLRGGIAADEFKGSFLRDKIEVYEDAIRLCLDSGDEGLEEEAFRLVELSKSRALADLVARYLRSGGTGKKAGAPGPGTQTRERLLKLIEDLNWFSSNAGMEDDKGGQRSALVADHYQRAVVRCERQIAQLFRRLEAEGSPFSEIQTAQAVSSEELREGLAVDESVLEYFMAGDEICAFVATSGGMKVLRGVAQKAEVERLLAAMRFQTEKFNYGPAYVESHFGQLMRSALDHLRAIYESVFKPIEPEIQTTKLIVIPHGQLHYVPFHALYNGRDYLIDRFEISYAPSASVLRLCRKRKPSSVAAKLLALGVAEEETPGINAEMEALEQVFPDSKRFLGEEATLANLLRHAPDARFLHLASHGGFRRDNPMFSFLKLADSRLNFYSLLDLKLDAELVTLSACRTGV
ncbi:MAG: CHAT domain-containing protein, partial [Blastocatellia bacterium]